MDTERAVRVGAAVHIPFVVVNESSKGTSAQLQLFSADAVLTQLLRCPHDTDGALRRRLLLTRTSAASDHAAAAAAPATAERGRAAAARPKQHGKPSFRGAPKAFFRAQQDWVRMLQASGDFTVTRVGAVVARNLSWEFRHAHKLALHWSPSELVGPTYQRYFVAERCLDAKPRSE